MTNRLLSLQMQEWRNFKHLNIVLDDRLTIITGPNGSGKSTILSLLNASLKDARLDEFIATPIELKSGRSEGYSFSTLFSRWLPTRRPATAAQQPEKTISIGTINYGFGAASTIAVPAQATLRYKVELVRKQLVPGFRIGSHRVAPSYQEVKHLPVKGINPSDAFSRYKAVVLGVESGIPLFVDNRQINNPLVSIKETLISFAAFGHSNRNMRAVPELIGLYEEFETTLRIILPDEIGFERMEVRGAEIVIVSRSGDFPVDGASGGLMSLIQTAWQIFLYSKANENEFTVIIDEPENHLHPSLQRVFMNKLVGSFPKVQFIVATHSPFIVSSVKNSRIYALKYTEVISGSDGNTIRKAVVSEEVSFDSKAGTASSILSEVLGVDVTLPVWAEEELQKITDEFAAVEIDSGSLVKLRSKLREIGLEEFYPQVMTRVLR